jgi:hypothetical protein
MTDTSTTKSSRKNKIKNKKQENAYILKYLKIKGLIK